MVSEEVFLQDSQQVVPSVQDDTILPVWVANHSTGFGWSSDTLMEFAMYTRAALMSKRLITLSTG